MIHKCRMLTCVLFVLLLASLSAEASSTLIFMSIQEQLSVTSGQTSVKVPVYVSDLTGLSIISSQFSVSYDSNVVTFTGVDLTGTLAAGAGNASNASQNLAKVSFAESSPFSGSGILIYLVFDAASTGTTSLQITNAQFNEGGGFSIQEGFNQLETPAVGASTVNFSNVDLQMVFSSNSAADEIRVESFSNSPVGTLPSGMTTVLNRYWVITRSGSGTFNVNLTFTLGAGAISSTDAANPGNLRIFRRSGTNTGSWAQVATAASANASTGAVTFNGISGFSQFTVGTTGDSSLPVKLAYFSASVVEDGVRLEWTTQTETGNLGFAIYRRIQGQPEDAAEQIRFVSGVGQSAHPNDYTFVDTGVVLGESCVYYLEDVNIEGRRIVSWPVEITAALIPRTSQLLPNYPNPFNPETWIPYTLAQGTEVSIAIYSAQGLLVRSLSLDHQPAGAYLSQEEAAYWDGRNDAGERVASGVFFYQLKAGDFTATRRMMVLR